MLQVHSIIYHAADAGAVNGTLWSEDGYDAKDTNEKVAGDYKKIEKRFVENVKKIEIFANVQNKWTFILSLL